MKAFKRGIAEAGKPSKLSLVAANRKLFTTLNATLKHDQPWTA